MTEITPTLKALGDTTGDLVLELGCGNGRYTVLILGRCRAIVAVDFSRAALAKLSQRAGPRDDLLLVHADITKLSTARESFGAALSTLVSNLPTREHREAMYRLVAGALRTDGRFVFGTHLHGIRQRYLRIPKRGRYPDADIYRYNFTLAECRSDPSSCFGRVKAHPVQIYIPVLRRASWPSPHRLSRALERIPVLNLFGALTVCTATLPRSVQ
jgi:SAM-dependent methyltransferase